MTRRGQTLLELVIAAGVLMVTVTAAITLIVRTVTVGSASQEKTEAINYAREGVEVIRSLRDSNWLKASMNLPDGTAPITAWDDDATGPNTKELGDVTAPPVPPAAPNVVLTLDPTVDGNNSEIGWNIVPCVAPNVACTSDQKRIWLQTRSGVTFATQGCTAACAATGTATRYSRVIQIYRQADVAGDYLEVRSTVTWNASSGLQKAVAETRLYNWK